MIDVEQPLYWIWMMWIATVTVLSKKVPVMGIVRFGFCALEDTLELNKGSTYQLIETTWQPSQFLSDTNLDFVILTFAARVV